MLLEEERAFKFSSRLNSSPSDDDLSGGCDTLSDEKETIDREEEIVDEKDEKIAYRPPSPTTEEVPIPSSLPPAYAPEDRDGVAADTLAHEEPSRLRAGTCFLSLRLLCLLLSLLPHSCVLLP